MQTVKQKLPNIDMSLWAPASLLLLIILVGFITGSSKPLPVSEYNEIQEITLNEADKIELWIRQNDLNEYGDPKETVYPNETPLILDNGREIELFEYMLSRHPDAPWLRPIDE